MPTYLPNAVIMNLKAGVCDSTSQAEMRDLSVMFVQLTNLNTEDNDQTQIAIQCVQEATYQVEGSINKVIVDDKGALVLCVFGLPPMVHADDSYRAIAAAFLMRHHLHDLGLTCRIGIATNRVFCGIVGSELRKEYTVMGVGVNLSARLMARAKEYDILTDKKTYEQCKNGILFREKGSAFLKGFNNDIETFRPISFSHHKTKFEHTIGNEGELMDLEAMVEIVAHGMANCIIIMGKPGTGKHTIAHHLDEFCEHNDLVIFRSGIGENMYLDVEISTMTKCTSWRKIFVQAMCMLHGERTRSRVLKVVETCSSSDLCTDLGFNLVDELRLFLGDQTDEEHIASIRYMLPELRDVGELMPDSLTAKDEHDREVLLLSLLREFFVEFCKTHRGLFVFENHYGMANSQVSGNTSWTLFHDLWKNFTPVVQKDHGDVEDRDSSDEESDPLLTHPMFAIVTNSMAYHDSEHTENRRIPVEFLEALNDATEKDTLLEICPMLDCDSGLLIAEKLNAHGFEIEEDILRCLLDLGEGNPSIICELCHSVLEDKIVVHDADERKLSLEKGSNMLDLKLNSKLRHMVLQEVSLFSRSVQVKMKKEEGTLAVVGNSERLFS